MLTVKVIQLPGAVQEVALEDGATVDDALNTASVSADGCSIKVDGSEATRSTQLTDGARVIVARSAKGNV